MSRDIVDLPRLQHFHEGQRSARRPFHHQPDLRHLRRQSRHLFGLRAEHGLRHQTAGAGGVDHQSRRSRRVHVRSQYIPGQSGRGRFLRADGEGDQPGRLGKGPDDIGAARRRARLPHHRRYHDGAQSVLRRVLSRDASGQPLHPRDVQSDGGTARPSFDALSRRRRHGPIGAAVHRVHGATRALRRVHEEMRAAARRFVRFLL